MSVYRRFISYMYDCDQNRPKKNCGFLKIEVRNNRCMIIFQLNNAPCQDICNIYLCFQDTKPEYHFLQSIPVQKGCTRYKIETSSLHMTEKNYNFSQCIGILCTDEKGGECCTCWDPARVLPKYEPVKTQTPVIRPSSTSLHKPAEPELMSEDKSVIAPEPASENKSIITPEPVSEDKPVIAPESASEDKPVIAPEPASEDKPAITPEPASEDKPVIAPEPASEDKPAITPEPASENKSAIEAAPASPKTSGDKQKSFSELWEYMQKEFPSVDPFEDNAVVETIKIAPSDLGYLQACNLNLGSNQFMLHGYKCYQHLLMGRLRGQMQYVIGIPGIYDPQEQFMAKMFGFPCFKPIRECRQKNGQFGYWLRCFR